jgi:protein-disulfide isomerase
VRALEIIQRHWPCHRLPLAALTVLPLAALTVVLLGTGPSCVSKQASQPCTTESKATAKASGKQPPKTKPDCKTACEYFTYCQSARWTSPTEEKMMADRCIQQCVKPDAGQMKTFFSGIKTCAVNRACVQFGDCMKKLVEKLQSAEAPGQSVEDPNAIYNVPVGGSPVRGPAGALVTVVTFADYECPFCGRGNDTVNWLLKAYPGKVRLVYKHYPLPSHTGAKRAAEMAFCVMKTSGAATFWKLHDKLYQSKDGYDDKTLLAAARSVGAGAAQVKACMEDKMQLAPMAADMTLGTSLGVDGTPAFFINGKKIVGAQPLDVFKKEVDAALKKAEAAVKSGVKPADVYAHLTGKGHDKVQLLKGQGGQAGHGPGDGHDHGGPPELDPSVVFRVPVTRNDPAMGPKDALVTIVEFADFQSPSCAAAGQALKKLVKAHPKDIRLVFRNFPLPTHPDAALAAEAALAVRAQKGDKGFFEYHDKVYANMRNLGRPVLERLAKEMGVDLVRFKKGLDSHTYKAQVDADRRFAEAMGVPGTPALYINGRVIMGLPAPDVLTKRLADEIAAAKKIVAKGVTRATLYDSLMKIASTKPVFKKR